MNKIFFLSFLLCAGLFVGEHLYQAQAPRKPTPLELARVFEAEIYANLRFQEDKVETWTLPAETLRRGYGDCEDFALVFLQALKTATGLEGSLLIVHYGAHPIDVLHAEVFFQGELFLRPVDLSPAQLADRDVAYVMSYEEAFAVAQGLRRLRLELIWRRR